MPIANASGLRQSEAVFKTNELEVMRLVLPKGKSMPAHKVAGDITVQCLEGSIEFTSDGATQVLVAGEMLYLAGGVPHSLPVLKMPWRWCTSCCANSCFSYIFASCLRRFCEG
jgi:quercetin dioxygenase-like cupin family protein